MVYVHAFVFYDNMEYLTAWRLDGHLSNSSLGKIYSHANREFLLPIQYCLTTLTYVTLPY